MLQDPHLSVVKYAQKSMEVFPDVDIKGGVVVTVRNQETSDGPIGSFSSFPELNSILHKVKTKSGFSGLDNEVVLQNKFNLKTLYTDYSDFKNIIGSKGKEKRLTTSIFTQLSIFTSEKKSENDVQILGLVNNKREYKWINRKYLDSHQNLENYKVIIPKSNGTGAIGEVLSTPLIGEPLIGFTQSFISIGAFQTRMEAEAAYKYIKTKFARTMLGTLKITQDNNKETWANVPIQDFTETSDIDWSQSIEKIDIQLYRKYGLTKDEIAFIEEKVQAME